MFDHRAYQIGVERGSTNRREERAFMPDHQLSFSFLDFGFEGLRIRRNAQAEVMNETDWSSLEAWLLLLPHSEALSTLQCRPLELANPLTLSKAIKK